MAKSEFDITNLASVSRPGFSHNILIRRIQQNV